MSVMRRTSSATLEFPEAEMKKWKTEVEMDGLCLLEENCVCRSDPTTKWERLEEEDS